ncbi:hypothetical protein EDB87DRAFT_97488 [Lactarius vividus]|nr:hypothetical protein EDB87DRAFT_97488 [Lactarius vividus]
MEATSKPSAQPVASQPQQAVQMNALNPAAPVNSQQQHEHKARRLRGGGAGRDCFIGLVECFICFECCKVRLSLPVFAYLPGLVLITTWTSPVFPHFEYFSF